MTRKPIALAAALTLFPVLTPALASAQGMLEEVIVTAQKKQESLTEAPVAVNLVSGAQLTDFAVFQADELNKLITGMEVRNEGDSRTGVGLRGVGTFQQQSGPARVGVYMDDYYLASQAAFALSSLFDMANVQTLKGPQGTLYGQPSPTGALILTTRDPDFDGVSGHLRGSYLADPMGYNLQAAINIPLFADTLAVRVAGLSDKRETGAENINPVNSLDEERNFDGFRVKMLWLPSDNLQLKLGYAHIESNDSDVYRIVETVKPGRAGYDPAANYPDLQAGDRKAIADSPSLLDRDDDFATLHINWQVGDLDVQWFSGFLESTNANVQDNDRTDIPSVILDTESRYGDDLGSVQHELRLSGEAFDRWEWTVGAYYQEAESQTDVNTFADRPENGGVFNIIIDIPIESEVKAIFTHNSIALSDDTELTIGVRYNEFDQSDGTVLTGDFFLGTAIMPGGAIGEPSLVFEDTFPRPDCTVLGGTGVAPCLVGAGNFGWEEWTGTIKLAHYFSDTLNAYMTLDRGFRPGAPNFDTTGVFSPDLTTYEGESVNSVEIGAKGDLLNGRARYTAAIFYSVYEDYQTSAVGLTAYNEATGEVEIPTNAPFVNVDEAVQRGIEADFRMQVTDDWMVYAGATWANVEFTDGTIPCTDPALAPVSASNRYNVCDADGETATAQPELTATLQTEYVLPVSPLQSETYVSGLWKFNGATDAPGDSEGRLDTDSYSVLDVYGGMRNATWSAQLFVKNVFDDDGVIAKRPQGFGYNEITVTSPRTVGVSASYSF